MKKKEKVIPPSKSKGLSYFEKKKQLEKKRSQITVLSEDIYKLEDELYYNDSFTQTVPAVAEKLNLDENQINEAFKDNKRELVSLFNSASAAANSAKQKFQLSGLFSLIAMGAGTLGALVDPIFFTITIVSGPCALIGTGEAISEGLSSRETLDDIRTKITSHNKRLPSPY
jgi:hypothetical protein